MTGLILGTRLALSRFSNVRSALAFGFAVLFVLFASLLERDGDSLRAADRALAGAAHGVALPLLAFFCLDRVCNGTRLEHALEPFARHGQNRRLLATGVLAITALVLALAGALLGALVVCVTRRFSDPVLLWDLGTTSWMGALAGVGYAAYFTLGSVIGRSGGGRLWALAIDWLLGSGASAWSMPFPRGHIRNLLGVDPLLALPFWSALLALLSLALVYPLLAVWRCPP